MKIIQAALVLFFGGLSLSMNTTDHGNSTSTKIDDVLEEIRSKYDLPALVALTIKDGAEIVVGESGTLSAIHAERARATHKFHLGSCSKAFTAVLVHLAFAERKFSPDSKLHELIDQDITIHDSFADITVANLLDHHGGFSANIEHERLQEIMRAYSSLTEQRREITKAVMSKPRAVSSTQFEYSNTGYIILAHVLERAFNRPYEQIVDELIFKKLSIEEQCGFGEPRGPNQPWPHILVNDRIVALDPYDANAVVDNPPVYSSAGTIHCTLPAWAKFLNDLLEGIRTRGLLLPAKEYYDRLFVDVSGDSYTQGAWVKTRRRWSLGDVYMHTGSNNLNAAIAWLAPRENLFFIAATNFSGLMEDGTSPGLSGADEAIAAMIDHVRGGQL